MSVHNSSSSYSNTQQPILLTQNDNLITLGLGVSAAIQEIIAANMNNSLRVRGSNAIQQDTMVAATNTNNSVRDNEAIQDIVTAIYSLRDAVLATHSSSPVIADPASTTISQEDEVVRTYMDSELYLALAAVGGTSTEDTVILEKLKNGNFGDVEVQVTSNNNTVLHVAAQSGKMAFVKEILNQYPFLLDRQNSKGEIPLHIAAREGHHDIVNLLVLRAKTQENQGSSKDLEEGSKINSLKDMISKANEDGDTALHEAVRNNHVEVVELLTKADPEFGQHTANKYEETPLYIAAEKGYGDTVFTILKNCTSTTTTPPAYGGPGGRTALHAAVLQGDDGRPRGRTRNPPSWWPVKSHGVDFAQEKGCIEQLLEWKDALKNEVDEYGWTPLHCAARIGDVIKLKQLLGVDKSEHIIDKKGKTLNKSTKYRDEKILDKSAAYIADNDSNTALHIAASQGHLDIIEELLLHCPDCWEKINTKTGQNILHVAVKNEKVDVIQYILKRWFVKYLLNQKDMDGNTPLHLLATSNCYAPQLIKHPSVDKGAYNKKHKTPTDQVSSIDYYRHYENEIRKGLKKVNAPEGWRNVVQKDREKMEKTKTDLAAQKKLIKRDLNKVYETHLVVAALIATVTFAAGFTLPGGYNNNGGLEQGKAVLTKNFAFKAFVVTDTIALVCSISAVFIYAITPFYERLDKIHSRHFVGFCLVNYALGAMVVAFITGIYAVLENTSVFAIAEAVCVICSFSFVVYIVVLGKWVRDNFAYVISRVEDIFSKCNMRFGWEALKRLWNASKRSSRSKCNMRFGCKCNMRSGWEALKSLWNASKRSSRSKCNMRFGCKCNMRSGWEALKSLWIASKRSSQSDNLLQLGQMSSV